MEVKKIGNKVEVRDKNLYMYLPASRNGYNIFKSEGGSAEYAKLFGVRIILKKK